MKEHCISVKELFEKYGNHLTYCEISTEDDDERSYYDLVDKRDHGILCMDGESCEVLQEGKDLVVLFNDGLTFCLTQEEYAVAVFQPVRRLGDIPVGDEFMIGEDSFIVLEQTDGRTFVISGDVLLTDQVFGKTPDYKVSDLRTAAETKIQPKIEAAVGAENVLEHVVDLVTVDMQRDFGTLNCKVRPFTFDEARKYNDLLVNKELDDWTWTCTPWSVEKRGWSSSVAYVMRGGDLDYSDCVCIHSIRPVMWLNGNIEVLTERRTRG